MSDRAPAEVTGAGGAGDDPSSPGQDPLPWGVKEASVWFHGPHGPALVLDAVSLAAPHGQVTATVGGDGAGKTTLLRVLAGRVIPATGKVTVPDRRRIGFMASNSGTWRDLTVDENVAFVGRAYGMTAGAIAARRDGLLGRAGLLDAAGRLAGRLSGGMRQKLGFCLAMLHEPELLILDEPSTGVDPVSRVELWRMIAETASSGRAVIMSTTYLDEAERVASVLVLDAGRVLYSGDPAGIAAAVPGSVVRRAAAPDAPARASTWRRGREFHSWSPGAPEGGTAIEPDLEDAVIALTLARGGVGTGEDPHA